MAFTQDGRHLAITTPLGTDVLLLKSISGHEGISQLFSFDVELLSEVDPAIDFDAIVGKNVTITLQHAHGTRFFNGIVQRFAQRAGDPTFAQYRATLVPTLWLFTQTSDCRIFQNKTVPDIIQEVLTGVDVRFNVVGPMPPREFCVQYRETDFNFVSRLMEQYGLFYYFVHEDGKHTMVIANQPDGEGDCDPKAVTYHATVGATVAPDDTVTELTKAQEIRPGKWAATDYNFETPKVSLKVSVDSVFPPNVATTLEMFDYPGEYQKLDEGDRLVKLRIEEEEAQRATLDGTSSCRQFTAGHRFELAGHARADFDGPYVLTSVTHRASEYGYDLGQTRDDHAYENTFTCMPARVPFRAPRVTPRPFVQGSQTAEVVGPKGEEIFTDKFGRVKVQFHWDREGKRDENSSCWIRVSHPWAGKGWGSVSIPRIGQEVIVDFLEGDPDQPIITGRVYNGELMPPYGLPAGGVVSGLKSNTTPGGGGSNEMSMDDTKGKELIRIHGQYDMATSVEHDVTKSVGNNETIDIGANRSKSVENNETVTIGGNRAESVDGNESISVGGNRTESVSKNESISIGGVRSKTVGKSETVEVGQNRSETVGKKEQVSIGEDRAHQIGQDDTLNVGKNLFIEAGDSITLKTGSASLTMKKDGSITLKGKDISIAGSGKIAVKADSDMVLKASKISQN